MNFTKFSEEGIKCFLPLFKSTSNKKTSINKSSYHKILKILHTDIYAAYKNTLEDACFKSDLVKINNNKEQNQKKPEIYNSRFFPSHIKSYVNAEEKYQLTYTCKVGGRQIQIHFTLFSETELLEIEKYKKYAAMIYMWLHICASYSAKTCANTLTIYIYPTPFQKTLPSSITTTIGVDHVNTAFTMHCSPMGEIVIYRAEEWFKVFIHETFHAYGLDFGANPNATILTKSLQTLFPIDSEYDAAEAYAETWARIMNCALCSFISLENKKDIYLFIDYLEFCLQLERLFTFYQCNKLLNFMGLTYEDIHGIGEKNAYLRKNLYRENTHVFAYYILTAIFLNDYGGFLVWCHEHNTSLLKFNGTDKNFHEIATYISDHYKNKQMSKSISITNELYQTLKNKKSNKYKKIINTSRMTMVEHV